MPWEWQNGDSVLSSLGCFIDAPGFWQMAEILGDDAAPSERHLRKIGMHVSAYVAHVRTQLKQTIPKAIVHCLVRPSCQCPHSSSQSPWGLPLHAGHST